MTFRSDQVVIVREAAALYPESPPFSPHESFPEAVFGHLSDAPNHVYAAVRGSFLSAGLDAAHAGTAEWNPLGEFIHPGETVLLKPNLICESHPRDPSGWRYTLTHGSVIRAVSDFVALALQGSGRIVVADAPQTDSSFEAVVAVLGLDQIAELFRGEGVGYDLIDLRQEEWDVRDGVVRSRTALSGDPRGNVEFDLGESSEFANHRGAGRYYGADYDSRVVNTHHTGGKHQYVIGRSVIEADVFFNLPKLKTHKKAGITVALKNLVGINGDKNWLPHHTEGPTAAGGDEHPDPTGLHRLERWGAARLRRLSVLQPALGPLLLRRAREWGRPVFGDTEEVIRSGNWWGNDTVWRMCLDLNKLLLYGTTEGQFRVAGPEGRKRCLVLVDGIVAGEGRGPTNPDPVAAGLVMFGVNPASVDAAAAVLMGFDPDRIPVVREAFCCRGYALAEWDWKDINVVSEVSSWQGRLGEIREEDTFRFEPHFAWKGHIERSSSSPD